MDDRPRGWVVPCALALLVFLPNAADAVSFRWSESARTIYVVGPGQATLQDIQASLPTAPLTQVSPRVWFLGANLLIQQGGVLLLYGTNIGNVDLLLLKSNNLTNGGSFVSITAEWGGIDIRNTTITSWDEAVQGPDTEYATYRRAYIRVRSRLDTNGVTPRESRMDIVGSDIGYLGYAGAEAYGLSWKVAGTNENLFEKVDVYGDVIDSRVHHNYYGIYTYGALGMRFLDNTVYSNVVYGIDPHDDSDHLLVEGNEVFRNGKHGIIASKRCEQRIPPVLHPWPRAST